MRLSYREIRKRVLKPDEHVKPWYPRVITHAISTTLIWVFQNNPYVFMLILWVVALSVPWYAISVGGCSIWLALTMYSFILISAIGVIHSILGCIFYLITTDDERDKIRKKRGETPLSYPGE